MDSFILIFSKPIINTSTFILSRSFTIPCMRGVAIIVLNGYTNKFNEFRIRNEVIVRIPYNIMAWHFIIIIHYFAPT